MSSPQIRGGEEPQISSCIKRKWFYTLSYLFICSGEQFSVKIDSIDLGLSDFWGFKFGLASYFSQLSILKYLNRHDPKNQLNLIYL